MHRVCAEVWQTYVVLHYLPKNHTLQCYYCSGYITYKHLACLVWHVSALARVTSFEALCCSYTRQAQVPVPNSVNQSSCRCGSWCYH